MTLPDHTGSGKPSDAAALAALRVLAAFLAGAPSAPAVAHYTSRSLPPGTASRRAFREAARKIPGAIKVGRDWTVTEAQWAAHFAARTPTKKKPLPVEPPPAGDSVDSLFAAGGMRLRSVAGGRRS